MNVKNSISGTLFSAVSSFNEKDYLEFLAQRLPKNIQDQLNGDCQPDLGYSNSISVTDLVRPLSSHVFPSDELWELAGILGYTIMCYYNAIDRNPARHNPYKLVYVVSLYLHCFLRGQGPEASGYLVALGILADVSAQLDLEARLQVCRFLGSLIPTICTEATTVSALVNEPAPASSVLVVLSVIVGSIVSELSLMAENTMKNENICEVWAVAGGPATCWGIGVLKRRVAEMYGASGKVLQVADRFLLAIEDRKNHEIE